MWIVLDSEGRQRVLKDFWLDFVRLPEHEILALIIEDIRSNEDLGDDFVRLVRKYMLTPVAYWKVCIRDNIPDDTTAVMMGGFDPSAAKLTPLTPTLSAASKTQSVGITLASDQNHLHPEPSRNQYAPAGNRWSWRYHYRIVFEECGTSVNEECDLGNVISALKGVIYGTRLCWTSSSSY